MFLASPNILPTVKHGNSHAYTRKFSSLSAISTGRKTTNPYVSILVTRTSSSIESSDTFACIRCARGRMHRCVLTERKNFPRNNCVSSPFLVSLRKWDFCSPRIPVFQYAVRLLTSKSRATTGKQRRTTFYPKQ